MTYRPLLAPCISDLFSGTVTVRKRFTNGITQEILPISLLLLVLPHLRRTETGKKSIRSAVGENVLPQLASFAGQREEGRNLLSAFLLPQAPIWLMLSLPLGFWVNPMSVTGWLCQILPCSLASTAGRRNVPRLSCPAQPGPMQGALWGPSCSLCCFASA